MPFAPSELDFITVYLPHDRFARLAELATRAFAFRHRGHTRRGWDDRLRLWYYSMDEATGRVRLGTQRRADRLVSDVTFIKRGIRYPDHGAPERICAEIFTNTHQAFTGLRIGRRRHDQMG